MSVTSGAAAPRLVIVDYGMGNIRSVQNAFARTGASATMSREADALLNADGIVLPGVGAFGEAVANLDAHQLVAPLREAVLERGIPLLGICLGMQLLADASEERGLHRGLGFIPGTVRRIAVPAGLRLPHVGWNSIGVRLREPLFRDVRDGDAFYFVHSYHFLTDDRYITAVTDYGRDVVAAVQRDHIFGIQFHPERSQSKGLALLAQFTRYVVARREALASC